MSTFDFETELQQAANIEIDWSKIDNKTILITGATGLIGKYLMTVLLTRNQLFGTTTKIVAMGRDYNKFVERCEDIEGYETVEFVSHDIQQPFAYDGSLDMIVHLASNTHPVLYASDPIGTELTNIFGTKNLLDLASTKQNCRFVFCSSGDIYGDNRSSKEFLSENDCGYIDCNTLRAGYIEGKRASEALCNAYKEANGVDFVIGRFCRIYGKTMQLADSKAISQFIKKAAKKEDIVLKSEGKQTFSYLYIFDAVTGLLTVMANGVSGNAYNIADNHENISLKDLASICAKAAGKEVVFDLPDCIESKGASSFQNVKLDGTKLNQLGWSSKVCMSEGLTKTIEDIRTVMER